MLSATHIPKHRTPLVAVLLQCLHRIFSDFIIAILWCFYPIGILVFIELLFSSDDDDDDEGGGVMSPVGVYQGA